MVGRRGPADPRRRERIVAATETVVVRDGVVGLTHRAVAREAEVPLGSTTYYFATLDDLRKAALQRLAERYSAGMHEWSSRVGHPGPVELIELLTDQIVESLGPLRDQTVVEYELTTAAMRNPDLRELAVSYSEVAAAALSDKTSPAKARALIVAFDGLLMHGLTSPTPLERADIAAVFAAILTPEQAS